MKKLLLSTVVAAGALFASSADAAFVINGGATGTISSPSNSGVNPVFHVNSMAGYYKSSITLAGTGTVTYEVLGYEAGAKNTFGYHGSALYTGAGNSGNVWKAVNSASALLDSGTFAGVLDFFFSTTDGRAVAQGGSSTVTNGSANKEPSVNFFATFGGDGKAKTGDVLYLFFDDRGGSGKSDDNHDDLAVRLTFSQATTFVPEPASLALFGAGLLGLGLVRRRKSV